MPSPTPADPPLPTATTKPGPARPADRDPPDAQKPAERCFRGMTKALREACQTMRDLLAEAARNAVLPNYEVARIILQVHDAEGNRYGDQAMLRVAKALGLHRTTPYLFAGIARRWAPKAITQLMSRVGKYGQPLTWTHLVKLSQVHADDDRQQLLEATLAEGLTVAEFQRRIVKRAEHQSVLDATIPTQEQPDAQGPTARRSQRTVPRPRREVAQQAADGAVAVPLLQGSPLEAAAPASLVPARPEPSLDEVPSPGHEPSIAVPLPVLPDWSAEEVPPAPSPFAPRGPSRPAKSPVAAEIREATELARALAERLQLVHPSGEDEPGWDDLVQVLLELRELADGLLDPIISPNGNPAR